MTAGAAPLAKRPPDRSRPAAADLFKPKLAARPMSSFAADGLGGQMTPMRPAYLDRSQSPQLDAGQDAKLDGKLDDRLDQRLDAKAGTKAKPGDKSAQERRDGEQEDRGGVNAADKKEEKGGGKPDAKGKAKGKGGKKGGKGTPGKLVELQFVYVPPVPVTGPVAMTQAVLDLPIDLAAFSAPRQLPFTGTAPPVKEKEKPQAPTPDQRDYPGLFAAAAQASYDLYRSLGDAARRVAEDARTQARRLADRHRDSLDRDLATLDLDLERSRARLAQGREEALGTLHESIGALRANIWGTAAASLKKLDELKGIYNAAMLGPRATAEGITSRTTNAITSLQTNSDKALEKLNGLKSDKGPVHSKDKSPWLNSVNEAIDEKLGETLEPEIARLSATITASRGALEKFAACLPCTLENAFAKMDARVKGVETAGPAAVKSARDAGLKSLGETELQLEDMIERGVAGTDESLVKQHDAQRERMIGAVKSNAESETSRIEGAARGQVRTLTALAAAQPTALQRVVDRLAEEKGRPEPDFARGAATASRRLSASVAGSAARQPATVRTAAQRQAELFAKLAERFDLNAEKTAVEAAKPGREMIDNALESFADQTGKAVDGLSKVPGQIAQACAGYLDPIEDGYVGAVHALETSLSETGAQIDAMLDGKAETGKGGEGEANMSLAEPPPVCSMDDESGGMSTMSPKPVLSSLSAPPPRLTTHAPPQKKAKAGAKGGKEEAKEGELSEKCGTCKAATAPKEGEAPAPKTPPPKPGGEGGTDQGQGGGEKPQTINALIKLTGEIGGDVLKDQPVKDFQSTTRTNVIDALQKHASKVDSEIRSWNPDGDLIVSELRGTTKVQGGDYRGLLGTGKSLDERISDAEWWKSIAWPSTIRANVRAARNALDGNTSDAAFFDLVAAYNMSDQNDRAEQALLNLSAADLAKMKKDHGAELAAMAKELSGANREKFEALLDVQGEGEAADATRGLATYNAIKMSEKMATARSTEGHEGWLKTGNDLGDMSRAAGSSRLAGNDDPFNIGDKKKAQARVQARWEEAQIAYGQRKGVVSKDVPLSAPKPPPPARPADPAKADAGAEAKGGAKPADKADAGKVEPPKPAPGGKEEAKVDPAQAEALKQRAAALSAAQDAIYDEATKTIVHQHHVSGTGDGDPGYDYETTDVMGDPHKLWIRRILQYGVDDNRTRAARLWIATSQKPPVESTRESLNAAMHFGSADAIENGHYNEEARAKGEAEARKNQEEVLKIYAQDKTDRENAGKNVCVQNTQKPEEIREELNGIITELYKDDEKGRKDALGIISGPKGNALAAMELAISKEKKEIAIEQLKRMDRKEIDQLIADWAAAHPGEKGLEAQLGINGHHWNWHNWNGATFSGDAANEIEIAFHGVPQNPKERGEIALNIMDQQIDQAGWLGKRLARGEFKQLEDNAAELRKIMGVDKAMLDERGHIMSVDPLTGLKVKWGNFDENGDFVPTQAGDASAFERAITLSRITADNYTHAVDRIANFVATALVVIAAIVTTVLTGGAAASIWIPVLVTAGAGLVGVGLNIAIKGGRYSRDEIVRDLIATVVMAATAGIGAGAGAFLRGGTPALKALGTSMRVSEKVLAETVAKAAGKKAAEAALLRSLTLGEEVLIGAGTSGLASAANAAFDPEARRRGDYWSNIAHSFGRGLVGGGLGALGARGGTKLFEAASRRLGSGVSQRAMAVALAAGKSEAEALKAGEQAVAKHWATEIGTRAVASGTSGALSRGGEMLYDKHVRNQDISYGEIFKEMGVAGLTNFIQGAGEGVGDRAMRSRYASRAAEQAWVDQQHDKLAAQGQPHEHAGQGDAEAETARLQAQLGASKPSEAGPAAPPVAGPHPEGEARAPGPRPAAEAETGALPVPGHPVEGEGALPPALRPGPEAEAPLMPVRAGQDDVALPATEPTDKALPPVRRDDPATTPVERKPVSGERTGEADVLQSLQDKGGGKSITGANDNGPTQARLALGAVDMVALGPIEAGTLFVHPDSRNRQAANDNFGRMVLADPQREVAVYKNPVTGEYVVIQGAEGRVGKINTDGELTGPGSGGREKQWQALLDQQGVGHWVLEHHFHPNGVDGNGVPILKTPLISRLPSGAQGDFRQVIKEVTVLGHTERSSRIYFIDDGHFTYTDFGINTNNRENPFWIKFPDPDTGVHTTREFPSMAKYHEFVGNALNLRYPLPTGFTEPVLFSIHGETQRRALASGSVHQSLSHADVAEINTVAQRAAAAPAAETHEALRGMGLVGEKESMARLHLVVNDETIPMETRKQIAALVLDANRADMVARGMIGADEPVHLVFHGAPDGRSKSIRESGIDMGKVKGGNADDFGRGLYFTTDLDNALLYARRNMGKGEPPGEMFPFLLRDSAIRDTMLDVRAGGRNRAEWDEFLDRTPRAYPPKQKLAFIEERMPQTARDYVKGTPTFRSEEPVRGEVFEAFLAEKGRSWAEIIHGDLGKDAMTGGIATQGGGEQFSVRSQRIADIFNEQLGARRAGQTPREEDVVFSILEEKKASVGKAPAEEAKKGAVAKRPAEEEAPAGEAPKPRRRIVRPPPRPEAEAPAPEAAAEAPAPKPAAKRGKKAAPAEPDQATAAATAAATEDAEAGPKKVKQGKRLLDPARAKRADEALAAAQSKEGELEASVAVAGQIREGAEVERAQILGAKPDATPEGIRIRDEIRRKFPDDERARSASGDTLADVARARAEAVREFVDANPGISPETRRYLGWLEGTWHFNAEQEGVARPAKRTLVALGKDVPPADITVQQRTAQEQKAVEATMIDVPKAEAEKRKARQDLSKLLRDDKGENYSAKKKVGHDEILGEERFKAFIEAEIAAGRKPDTSLNPDHLVPVTEMANMPEFEPIFDIYMRAPPEMRDRIVDAIMKLGDTKGNLFAMQQYPNQQIKGARSWRQMAADPELRAALHRYGYTDDDIRIKIGEEDAMREYLAGEIKKLVDKYRAELAPANGTVAQQEAPPPPDMDVDLP